MPSRNRPGKAERLQAKRQALLTANLSSIAADKLNTPNDLASKMSKAVGPSRFDKALRQSGTGRDRLKLGSYGVGFQGPRGFASPKGLVSRAEQTPGMMAPKSAGPTFGANASQRHAGDTEWAAREMGYDYSVPKPDDRIMVKRKGRWRKA